MKTVVVEHNKRFLVETRKLFHHRVSIGLWLGIILIPLFSVLDYIAARQFLGTFLFYRFVCTGGFLVLLAMQQHRFGHRHPFLISTLAFLFAGLTISLMVVRLGGFASSYYAGLLLVLVTYSVLLPLSITQSIYSSLLLYGIYIVPLIFLSDLTTENRSIFINNNFFFISFVIIGAVQCYDDTQARIREFNLRLSLNDHTRKLKYYAKHLEDEVGKRAKDISTEGLLGFSFINIVHNDYVPSVEETLLRQLLEVTEIKDFQFQFVLPSSHVMDVECNAKRIEKEGVFIGFQLVIRDISKRKKLEQDLIKSCQDVYNARMATILGLAKLAEYRDKNTGGHLERIREYCRILAEELAKSSKYMDYISKEYIDDLYSSSILHDIGKVAIPDAILLKPGKLRTEEFEIIKQHSIIGGDALKAIEDKIKGESFLTMGREIAYHHHERWDGTGYPSGLRGEEISLSNRIVALADVYDALTSQRSYKPAYSHELAKEIIAKEKGRHFDPQIVEAFLALEKKFDHIRQQFDY